VLERFLQEAKWWVAGGLLCVLVAVWGVKTLRNRKRKTIC
jgi:hypothetical protein